MLNTRIRTLCALCTIVPPLTAATGETPDAELDRSSALLSSLSEDAADESLRGALKNGKSWVNLRYRFESADDDNFSRDSHASTLRTVLGYETAEYEGFSGLLEFEDVASIGTDNYNSTVNNEGMRPPVPDPEGGEVNQAYVTYSGFEKSTVRLGRQRIKLANLRFVGNVGWRQNEQTYDGLSGSTDKLEDWNIFYAFISNVNRIFGDDSPMGDHRMQSHLLHGKTEFEGVGNFNVYAYLLDYDSEDALSTSTFGASLDGDGQVSDDVAIKWSAELATQSDAGDNPNDVDAEYYRLAGGPSFEGIDFNVMYEVLGGSGDTGDRFTTPLATLHKFNGWADKFLNTPDDGLEDLAVSVGGTVSETKLAAVWHDFSSNEGSRDYGTELDLLATREVCKDVTLGLKYADFSADDAAFSDADKFWFWLATSF